MDGKPLQTSCLIAGAGPAGMILGYLLARAGVDVIVLEKHSDFFRDFRGDTIHPSTLEILHELGLLQDFLKLPHQKTKKIELDIGEERAVVADFSHLPTHAKFIAFMPQWDFLNFLKIKSVEFTNFQLFMQSEAKDLIEEDGEVKGLVIIRNGKEEKIHAPLVVAADGRHSIISTLSKLKSIKTGVPIDVLWFKVDRNPTDPKISLGKVNNGHFMVLLERGNYWQCGYLIPKGGAEKLKKENINEFKNNIISLQPLFQDRLHNLSWQNIKLLTVEVSRMTKWYKKGLLCIGDSAHAMSPIGGVGINLAIQDAVAAANILHEKLLNNNLELEDLAKVQARREFPTKATQKFQQTVQNRLLKNILKSHGPSRMPLVFKLFNRFHVLRQLPARFIGIGIRPEHISKELAGNFKT